MKPIVFPKVESSIKDFDQYNREIPDDRPLELLISLQNAVKTNEQRMKELITRELNKLARVRGYETFEESNDFTVPGEDYQQLSGYEYVDTTPMPPVDAAPVSPGPSIDATGVSTAVPSADTAASAAPNQVIP